MGRRPSCSVLSSVHQDLMKLLPHLARGENQVRSLAALSKSCWLCCFRPVAEVGVLMFTESLAE